MLFELSLANGGWTSGEAWGSIGRVPFNRDNQLNGNSVSLADSF